LYRDTHLRQKNCTTTAKTAPCPPCTGTDSRSAVTTYRPVLRRPTQPPHIAGPLGCIASKFFLIVQKWYAHSRCCLSWQRNKINDHPRPPLPALAYSIRGFAGNKYAKPAHECDLQLPARASRAATLPNKPVNAMLAYDIHENVRFLSKLIPEESYVILRSHDTYRLNVRVHCLQIFFDSSKMVCSFTVLFRPTEK